MTKEEFIQKIEQNEKDVKALQEIGERIKKELQEATPQGFETFYDGEKLRLSSLDIANSHSTWPIRLSILEGSRQGFQKGKFTDEHSGNLPGITLTIKDAKRLSEDLLKCIKYMEKNNG